MPTAARSSTSARTRSWRLERCLSESSNLAIMHKGEPGTMRYALERYTFRYSYEREDARG
eukprot:scaffold68366_cov45-Prasinocladus_malaysianus.AAC.1